MLRENCTVQLGVVAGEHGKQDHLSPVKTGDYIDSCVYGRL